MKAQDENPFARIGWAFFFDCLVVVLATAACVLEI